MKKIIFILTVLLLLTNVFFLKRHSGKSYNILIFCVNCLNKNRIGVYNSYFSKENSNTPYIDAFAENAVVFDSLYSPATYTSPSVYELLTSNDFKAKRPEWTDIKNNISFSFLKDKGYKFYFPYSMFGEVYDEFNVHKSPFFIFDHPDQLHDPYDIEFRRCEEYTKRKAHVVSCYTKKVSQTKEAFSHSYYRVIFGAFSRIYEKDIKNKKYFYDILAEKKGTQYDVLMLNSTAELSENDEDRLSFVLNSLNNAISIDSKLMNIIKYKNDTIQIGDVIINIFEPKNDLEKKLISHFDHLLDLQFSSKIKIENDGIFIQNIELFSNFNIFHLKMFYFCVVSVIFPEFYEVLQHKLEYEKFHSTTFKDFVLQNENSDFLNEYEFDDKEILEDFYDENLIEIDKKFGNIIKTLKERNEYDKTIIVLLGDHGDALLEHNDVIGHGTDDMYNEIINPPLIIKFPDIAAGKKITAVVSMKDILPTVLEYMGYTEKIHMTKGNSFLSLITGTGKKYENTVLVKGINNSYSLITDDKWKIIYNDATDQKELYNLNEDEREKNDLSNVEHDKLAQLYEMIISKIYKK